MQLVEWVSGRLVVREHLGSAHTPGELAALIEVAKQRIQGDQQAFDLELSERGAAVIDVRQRQPRGSSSPRRGSCGKD